jgi:uncharacterized protein (TIGR03435 family)
MKKMLQSLLAERFQMKFRRETKDVPIYAITIGKGGPKLTKSDIEEKDCPEGPLDSNSCHVINGGMGRGLHARAADLSDVVSFVGNWSDRPMIDKTGLKGLYKLDTEGWVPIQPVPARIDGQPSAEEISIGDPSRPTMAMIFERLGLRMESQRGPVDFYVIEQAEKPSGN